MRKILYFACIILIFLGVFWVADTNWNDFKNDIELKNPLNVLSPIIPEVDNPDITVNADNELDNNLSNSIDNNNLDSSNNGNNLENLESNNNLEDLDNDLDNNKINKTDIDNLISNIKVNDNKKEGYNREDFEKPTKYFYIDNTRYTRNKYAWHISKYLVNEEPFEYICPYTELTITDMSILDFEHIVPLSYVYKYGDTNWTKEQMNTYSYDQLIGMDVLNKANRSHSDKGPSEWLPEKNIGNYCFTWLMICNKYNIAMNKKDIEICKLEIYNALSVGEEVTFINQFKEDTEEYKLQQEWLEEIKNL